MSSALLRPWRHPGELARAAAYTSVGLVLTTLSFAVTLTLLFGTLGLAATVVLAVPSAWLLFTAARGLSALERSRAAVLLGVTVPDAVPPLETTGWLRRLGERLTSRHRWREVVHHLAAFPVALVGWSVVVTLWSGSLALVLLPAYVAALPGDAARFWLFDATAGPTTVALAALGAVGLILVAPWATLLAAELQLRLAERLLGRTTDMEWADVARRLERRRSAAVDSAEAERRRIERDLHDGAQQRLVALAAELGAAREKFDADPEAARVLVADAHEEAKAALKEIRDLVRGIHPVILEDRGLDAALSAVVARMPIPVELDVRLPERPTATAESAAYFVVSEALTNVARHAEATRAHVAVARAGDRLVVEVHDDGHGGADASVGTGLQGLRERVTGLGGTLHVLSPVGGPTTISVELPCGS
jgi:signal transduction histidine kinase